MPNTHPASPGRRSFSHHAGRILTVVLVYASFASLWILFSDKAVNLLFADPAQIMVVSTLKGWLFVLVTSLLLYGLLRRGQNTSDKTRAPVPRLRALGLPFVLLATIIVTLTAAAIVHNIAHERSKELTRLQAIAELKAAQINLWLDARRADAQFLHTSSFLAGRFEAWQRGLLPAREQMLRRLEEFGRNYGYHGVLLLDGAGRLLTTPLGEETAVDASLQEVAQRALADGKVHVHGPYRDAGGQLYLDFVAALSHVRAVLVLRVDPAAFLYPTLREWPAPSVSGETVLFRRDGENVLLLNELRHRSGAALTLRVPLMEAELLASQILRGTAKPGRAIQGVDYQQKPVIGVAHAIVGTDWYLLAKVDQEEIYAEATRDAIWVALVGLLGLFMAGASTYVFRQRQLLTFSRAEREAQAEKLRALGLLDAIATGSPDTIFAKDTTGRYLLFNRAAERVTGKAAADVLGHDDTVLFPPTQAALVMASDRQVMAEGRTITLTETLRTANGETVFDVTKGPLRDAAGQVVGMFGISRDITERKRMEDELTGRNEELERFNRTMVGREIDMIALKRRINELSARLDLPPPHPLDFADDPSLADGH